MKLEGRIWKFGSDVDTDAIIPARYLNQSDPKELAKHVMEEERPEFLRKSRGGSSCGRQEFWLWLLPGACTPGLKGSRGFLHHR